MRRIYEFCQYWAVRHTYLVIALVIVAAGVTAFSVHFTQAVNLDPDPQVIYPDKDSLGRPGPWPLPNTGRDANGLTLDEFVEGVDANGWTKAKWVTVRKLDPAAWVAKIPGRQADQYRPIEKRIVSRSKDGGWHLLHNQCFVNKTEEAKVYRAYLGGVGVQGTNRSVRPLDTIDAPTRTDGCAVKNHWVPLAPNMLDQVWTYQSGVNFIRNSVQRNVRVNFTPVVIEVVP